MPPKKNGKAVPKQTAKSKFLGAPKKKPDEFDVDAMMKLLSPGEAEYLASASFKDAAEKVFTA